ncbi:MAG: HD domain-containing protein [Candidatus Omnitrophica bacterium]|nr:HD domain-containing protein [Candidatus Omnitrophota bacterium]
MKVIPRRNRFGRKAQPVDYHEALREIAKSMVRLKRPERLLKMITRFITRELGLTHAAILVLEPEKSRYTIFDSKGVKKLPRSLIRLDLDHPIIRWFRMTDKETEADRAYISKNRIQALLRNPQIYKNRPEVHESLVRLQRAMGDYRVDIAIPGHFKEALVGILLLGEKLSRRLFTQTEISFFQTLVHDAAIAVKTSEYHERLIERNLELEERLKEIERLRKKEQETYYEIMKSLAQEVHAKDPYTFGHIHQVERLGVMTAEEMGLDLSGRKKAVLSAGLLLHDVGKIGIPDNILKKPSALDTEEWKVMRTHVEKGVKILEPLTDFKEVTEIVRCHHECYDGSGYPRGLRGDQIPIEARIVSVVDAFHAIVSTRCYREGRSIETALQELQRNAGTQFDPQVVGAFLRAFKKNGRSRKAA